jgi:hypothetical protein
VSDDLEIAVRMLAADNCRMIDILIAAEELATEIERMLAEVGDLKVETALARYKQTRNGQ